MPYENDEIVLPTEILRAFEPWMLTIMCDAGQNGGSKTNIMLATGLSKRVFNSFINPADPEYNADFEEAFELATMMSQAHWENIGKRASQGEVTNHAAGTFKFMVTNSFKDYKDEQVVTHNGKEELPSISADLSPVEAGQKYKQLLLESSMGDFLDLD